MSGRQRRLVSQTAGLRQVLGGLAITLISVGMLLGGFLLSGLDKPGVPLSPTSAPIALRPSRTPLIPTATYLLGQPTIDVPSLAPPATETAPPSLVASPIPTLTPTPPPTLRPTQSCTHPANWIVYIVKGGDTVSGLAIRAGITPNALLQANCLDTSDIYASQRLYVPSQVQSIATPRPVYPTATSTPYVCGPPAEWVAYVVQPGDTLYGLSVRVGVPMGAIRRANCLTVDTVYVGRNLYLPSVPPPPTLMPTKNPSPLPVPAESPTAVHTPGPTVAPILTPTAAQTPIPPQPATSTHTSTLTRTPVPPQPATSTHTSTPTQTPVPPQPATSTHTSTPAQTLIPPQTATSTHTSTPTQTPVPPQPSTSTHTPTPWTIG